MFINVEVQANLAHSFKINMRLNWNKNRHICMKIFMTVIPRNWCINKSSAYTAIQLHMTTHKLELCKNSRTMTVFCLCSGKICQLLTYFILGMGVPKWPHKWILHSTQVVQIY